MLKLRTHRSSLVTAVAVTLMLCSIPQRAHAVSKEMVQLQTQVQQLLDMVQRLQSTMDTRFAVMQNLAQQTADQATQMGTTVNTLQQKLNAQDESLSGKLDANSGQVQSLNDSVDELKTRIGRLEKAIQDLQGQLQNAQTPPTGGMPANASPSAGESNAGGAPASQAPPLKQTYQAAVSDFNAAKYSLATSEFQDVVHYYPLDNLAGSAQYYLGEIAYRQKNYDEAIKAYNVVLEQFSGNTNASAAQLHKGFALLAQGRRDAGVHELRSLIQRHPQTLEAAQARAKLNGLGVRISPRS